MLRRQAALELAKEQTQKAEQEFQARIKSCENATCDLKGCPKQKLLRALQDNKSMAFEHCEAAQM